MCENAVDDNLIDVNPIKESHHVDRRIPVRAAERDRGARRVRS
jgi:hypothetical protein